MALAPRCGDSHVDAGNGEQCDDGVENGATGDKCSATCKLLCGDGVVEAGERCDLGAASNTGSYGGCNPNCTLAPYCGDGIKNGNEQCDDGKNDGSYGTCNANCTLAGYCGDGIVQNPPETCDQGPANSATAYGMSLCTNRCTPAPYCGDKAVEGQFGETCDDGVNSGLPGSCTTDCKSFVPLVLVRRRHHRAPEQCDDGVDNGTADSKCDIHCRFKCGNGIQGPRRAVRQRRQQRQLRHLQLRTARSPATAATASRTAPRRATTGRTTSRPRPPTASGVCTTACTFAPYCGDGRVESQFGEQCDGTPQCSAYCQISIPH